MMVVLRIGIFLSYFLEETKIAYVRLKNILDQTDQNTQVVCQSYLQLKI
jgi:hypothetical protein